jgi:DNA-binding CsgD family transcriptional regulator
VLNARWRQLIPAVCASDLAVLLVEPPSYRILAASPAAVRLVSAGVEQPAGRRLVEFFSGDDSGGLELMAQGKVSAYETRRSLRATGEPVSVWVRSLPVGSPRCAVAVLLAQPAEPTIPPTRQLVGRVVAIGSVRADLMICSISSDIADIADIAGIGGFDAEKLIGTSILQLLEPAEACRLLELVAGACDGGARSAQFLRVRLRQAGQLPCEMLLVPHSPDGGYAFTIMDVRENRSSGEHAVKTTLDLLTSDARSAGGRRATWDPGEDPAAPHKQNLLGKLTSRELEVVTELLNGNRAPAIAGKLYLSPGTVRNHLSTAFRKLGVRNQQELIDLLRSPGRPRA